MNTGTPKPRFDFDSAGDIKLKIKNLEEGIVRAGKNFEIFSQQAKEQLTLQKTLQEELAKLKLEADRLGIKFDESN